MLVICGRAEPRRPPIASMAPAEPLPPSSLLHSAAGQGSYKRKLMAKGHVAVVVAGQNLENHNLSSVNNTSVCLFVYNCLSMLWQGDA